MSLFITELAFSGGTLVLQAKLGILLASLLGGTAGYVLLKRGGPTPDPAGDALWGKVEKRKGPVDP